MLLTFYFLYGNVKKHLNNKTHDSKLKTMSKEIEGSNLDEEYKNKLLKQLQAVHDDLLAVFQTLKLNIKFMFSAAFYAISFVHFLT